MTLLAVDDGMDVTAWRDYSILIVDDEPGMRSFLQRSLCERCAEVAIAGCVDEAEALLARSHFDLIILDIALPGRSGVDWLRQLREQGFPGDVMLMTAYATLETAIDALRLGVADFLLKPFSVAQMLNAVKHCFERSSLLRENFILRREVAGLETSIDGIVGQSEAIRDLCALIKRIAPTPATVLIQGESGTGKEVAARALHSVSKRSEGPFVPINCAAISPELIESELFGHIKGAFTGAATSREGLFYYARGGTLFLDEISELPLAVQAKLLRVLEEHMIRPVGTEQEVPVDVRVIAATNRRLVDEVAAGRFRRDLYYRLQVMELTMPPLRERLEDIPALFAHFVGMLGPRLGIHSLDTDAESMRALREYDWPGNVRELKNLVERSMILGYLATDFCRRPPPPDLDAEVIASILEGSQLAQPLEEVEKNHILSVLSACKGNKTEAARRLGLSRKTLDRKCAAWQE